MDRETRKNHPDEVFRIQFDLEEKRERGGGGGRKGEAGSSEQRIFICIVSSTTDRVMRTERSRGLVFGGVVFFFCFSLSLFFNVDLNEFIRASDYE